MKGGGGAHLTESNQQVLRHLPKDIHIHNAAAVSVAQNALALVAVKGRQHLALMEQLQTVPFDGRCCQHGKHTHQQAPSCD